MKKAQTRAKKSTGQAKPKAASTPKRAAAGAAAVRSGVRAGATRIKSLTESDSEDMSDKRR